MPNKKHPPPNTDPEVFKNGKSIAAFTAAMHDAEEWVKAVAALSGQRVDWHYSGGVGHLLYLGDREKVISAIEFLRPKLVGEFMRYFDEGHGLYRAGDNISDDVIAVDSSSVAAAGSTQPPAPSKRDVPLVEQICDRVRQWFADNNGDVRDGDGVDSAVIQITLMCSWHDDDDVRHLEAHIEERKACDALHGKVPD